MNFKEIRDIELAKLPELKPLNDTYMKDGKPGNLMQRLEVTINQIQINTEKKLLQDRILTYISMHNDYVEAGRDGEAHAFEIVINDLLMMQYELEQEVKKIEN